MKKLTHKEVLEYWKHPDEQNQPDGYLKPVERSEYLHASVFEYLNVPKDHKIIELGCNVGRNLHHLLSNGYRDLYGVEINEEAVHTWMRTYPKEILKVWIWNRPIENFMKYCEISRKTFDVVYTMAVLLHIHPDVINDVIEGMIRISSRYIAIIEWESDRPDTTNERIWGREYKPMFEQHGAKEIYAEAVCNQADRHLSAYTLRIFEVNNE